jgi:hypothetical protein
VRVIFNQIPYAQGPPLPYARPADSVIDSGLPIDGERLYLPCGVGAGC